MKEGRKEGRKKGRTDGRTDGRKERRKGGKEKRKKGRKEGRQKGRKEKGSQPPQSDMTCVIGREILATRLSSITLEIWKFQVRVFSFQKHSL